MELARRSDEVGFEVEFEVRSVGEEVGVELESRCFSSS